MCYQSTLLKGMYNVGNTDGSPIVFPEWAYLGKGKFQRRDFSLGTIQKNSAVKSKDSLFSHFDMDQNEPLKTYQSVNIKSLAKLELSGG